MEEECYENVRKKLKTTELSGNPWDCHQYRLLFGLREDETFPQFFSSAILTLKLGIDMEFKEVVLGLKEVGKAILTVRAAKMIYRKCIYVKQFILECIECYCRQQAMTVPVVAKRCVETLLCKMK